MGPKYHAPDLAQKALFARLTRVKKATDAARHSGLRCEEFKELPTFLPLFHP